MFFEHEHCNTLWVDEAPRGWAPRGRAGLPLTGVATLVVRGERDGSAAYPSTEQAAGIATGAEVVSLSGQGHLGHIFAPAAFAATIRAFLDRN